MNFYPSITLVLLPPTTQVSSAALLSLMTRGAELDKRFTVALDSGVVYLEGLGNYVRVLPLAPDDVAAALEEARSIATKAGLSARALATIDACGQALRLSSGPTNDLSYIEVMSEACSRLDELPGAIFIDLDSRTIDTPLA